MDNHIKIDEGAKDGEVENESAAKDILQEAAAFCKLHVLSKYTYIGSLIAITLDPNFSDDYR